MLWSRTHQNKVLEDFKQTVGLRLWIKIFENKYSAIKTPGILIFIIIVFITQLFGMRDSDWLI